ARRVLAGARCVGTQSGGEPGAAPSSRGGADASEPEQLADAVAVAAPGHEARAVLQPQDVLAAVERFELADALDVDDERAVQAREAGRVETGLERADALAHEVRLRARVHAHVRAYRLDVVD